ncbi:ATP-binding protein [Nisaea nitritireducens]|uniref:ATP-binding protein n=1 Tax=Nisaea nitritireducens TaxID=568392 RepID=UPI0018675A08|nr:ATP-binding protein [Nisaea nitritireducens]
MALTFATPRIGLRPGMRAWFLFTPLLTIAIFTGLFIAVLNGTKEQRDELRERQSSTLLWARQISGIGEQITEVHLAMLEAMGKAHEVEKVEFYDLARPTMRRLHEIRQDIRITRETIIADPEISASATSLLTKFEQLRKQYVSAIVSTSVDFSRFDGEMRKINRLYLTVVRQLDQISSLTLRMNEDASIATEEHNRQITRSLIGGLALAVLISVIMGWVISTRISGDLRSAIGALSNVANGKPSNIGIDKSRKDELGALARAIAFFDGILDLLTSEISERERNEAQLRNLFDSAGDAILVMEDGKYVSANKQAERMFGFKASEIQNYELGAFADPASYNQEDLARIFKEKMSAALRGEPQRFEWSNCRLDGTAFPTECTVAAFAGPDGKNIVQMIIRDITSRKEAERLKENMTVELERMVSERTEELQREVAARRETEEALEAERRTLEATVEYAPLGMALLDIDARIVRMNSWVKRVHGIPDAISAPGMPYQGVLRHIFNAKPEGDFKGRAKDDMLASRIANLEAQENSVFEDRLPDGSVHKVDRRFIDGVGYIITFTDITDLKNVQNDLVRQEKMAALGGLVAGVAHEVNTPLGICVTASSHVSSIVREFSEQVQSPTGGLTRKLAVEKLTQTGEGLGIIEKNLARAADLIKSFKLVAVDQTANDEREIELGEYIQDTLQSLIAETKRKKLNIDLVRPEEKLTRRTFPGALVQVVTNLVMNVGIHAYENHGGDIRLEVERLSDGSDRIIVRDFGKGMDKETQAQIFDPFFTTKRANGGTGLGMHIVFNLVTQRLGGRIHCKSTPGEGTEFEIILPQTPADESSATPATPAAASIGGHAAA